MWIESLTEIVPGLVVLGYVLLWWQAHADLRALRREWNEQALSLFSALAEAESWEKAAVILKERAGESDA